MSTKQKKVFWPILTILSISISAFVFGHSRHGRATIVAETNARRLSESRVPAASEDTVKAEKAPASSAQVAGPSNPSPAAQPQQRPTRTKLEGELVALRPSGFEPKQITRRPGPFVLVIENDSRLPSFTMLLKGDVGLPLRNVLVPREKRNWSDMLELPPGKYQLSEASHPEWVCNITIR